MSLTGPHRTAYTAALVLLLPPEGLEIVVSGTRWKMHRLTQERPLRLLDEKPAPLGADRRTAAAQG